MILRWKENPDWTDEEATDACADEVDRILFRNFNRTYKHLLTQVTDIGARLRRPTASMLIRASGRLRIASMSTLSL
jgi:hypothetical protein